MATLDSLKQALQQTPTSRPRQPLSETQYRAGFDILVTGPGWEIYQEFIIPQLAQLLGPIFESRSSISVLEVGPGPKTVLGYLPDHHRTKITRYAAFEPNSLFVSSLEEWLCPTLETKSLLPFLERPPTLHQLPFGSDSNTDSGASGGDEKFDVVLFCHSMYDMQSTHGFIRRALDMLAEGPQGGLVVVFHRSSLHLDGLACYRTAAFNTGAVRVANKDEELDCFSSFIAGFAAEDEATRARWRHICRALGRREQAQQGYLLFSAPNIMAAFTRHATTLPELMMEVPLANGDRIIKNRDARLNRPAATMKPTEVRHVQECVRWALRHDVGLTVIGGGHSGHCLWPNVVAVDMGAFNQIQIFATGEQSAADSLVVAGAGCTTGGIVRETMAAGLTVPLGARPSVGAGLWLQGGIGHLARLHGLACDAIVGAVVVGANSGKVFSIGHVPIQSEPAEAERLSDTDLLWAMKGAGTNFGIVVSVTLKAYPALKHSVTNWVVPLGDESKGWLELGDFENLVARELPRSCSADAYLYWHDDRVYLGVTLFEASVAETKSETPKSTLFSAILGPQAGSEFADGIELFETEMYMSTMHGGHGGGKTSSFKRCLFLKHIGRSEIAKILVGAVEARPNPLSYLHLLQGGGAVTDVAGDSTAFGCRDWDFACVITGVWSRERDGTEAAASAVRWVYEVTGQLLPFSSGVYSADLGPDPRDAGLAAKAFGANLPRLAHMKQIWDPRNVLAYACPLRRAPLEQKLIITVTGESGAGKDYSAKAWVAVFISHGFTARVVSISEATKREYAVATGTDLHRLLWDRAYKEQYRPALTSFFEAQVQRRPWLPEEHFLNVVSNAADVEVLLITGMRDEAPVATLSHLVPNSRLLEVWVEASQETRAVRRGGDFNEEKAGEGGLDYRPSLVFSNTSDGTSAAGTFAEARLLPLLHPSLQRLATMARSVPEFPRPGITFRHILGISQQPDGLALCSSLLQDHFTGDWDRVSRIVCVEVGGLVYASALAARVDVPLALIREAGKLPPPTVQVFKEASHISGVVEDKGGKEMEMELGVIPRGGTAVVVVDDVLATGKTLCAVLRLLGEAGVEPERLSVMVVAEFPAHRGRELLRRQGFGTVHVQSLLVYGGA